MVDNIRAQKTTPHKLDEDDVRDIAYKAIELVRVESGGKFTLMKLIFSEATNCLDLWREVRRLQE